MALKWRSLGRAAIFVGYTTVFWLLLPAALLLAASAIDRRLGWPLRPQRWGWIVLLAGVAALLWGVAAIRRGARGWPIGALPPPRQTRSGPYRHVRHPIYLAFNTALLGAGLVLGSQALTLVVAPAFLPLWVLYAMVEERGLVRRFGESYRRYQRQVGLFPRLGLYRVSQAAARLFPLKVEGHHHVPRHGPAILVASHACYLDPVYLSTVTTRPIHFLTTAEAYRKGFLAWLVRRFVNVPVRRYRPDPVACREMLRLLQSGEVIGIFPEGERSAVGQYAGAQKDVARVLARLPFPVVPVGLSGNYDCGPRWAGILRSRLVSVRIGRPIAWSDIDPAWDIDTAIRALLECDPQPLRLPGLPRHKLAKVLWRCPRCLEPEAWRPADLACGACGVSYQGTPEGWLLDGGGAVHSLASLANAVRAAPETCPITTQAVASREASVYGPIRPLEPLGQGALFAAPEGLRFEELEWPTGAIRSVSTERANTLQIGTADGMWQFRCLEGSAFRLHGAIERWRRETGPSEAHAAAVDSVGARP